MTHFMNLYLKDGSSHRCQLEFIVNPITSQHLYEVTKVTVDKTGAEVPLREVWENNQKTWVVNQIAEQRHGEYAKEHQGQPIDRKALATKKRVINRPKKADEML